MKRYIIYFILLSNTALIAADGDFKTHQTGNWNSTNTWERHNGSTWIYPAPSTPTYADGDITIENGHTVTVTANVTVDQVNVKGILTINAGITVIVYDGTGTDLNVDNTEALPATLNVYGIIDNKGTVSKSDGTIRYYNGGKYIHNQAGGSVEISTWDAGSTCEITGATSNNPSGMTQTFSNFTWNCPLQSGDIDFDANLTTINGNFSITNTNSYILALSVSAPVTLNVGGNFSLTAGKFAISDGAADNVMNVSGNFQVSGTGTIFHTSTGSGHCRLNLYGDMTLNTPAQMRQRFDYDHDSSRVVFKKSGTQQYSNNGAVIYYKIHFTVVNGSTLDLGTSVLGHYQYSTGDFKLEPGAGIKTAHASGITATSGITGCIQLMGTRSYSAGANYTYYAAGSQATGNGLPSPLTATITIGSATNTTDLTFSGSIQINGTLILWNNSSVASANLSYGANATLEYQGTVNRSTGNNEWPSSQAQNVRNSNSGTITLNGNKQINATLYLSAGTFAIGANTLTLNGLLNRTAGAMTGGSSSIIIAGGASATKLDLPVATLQDLTLNRSASGIRLLENLNIEGLLTMVAGVIDLNSKSLTYGSAGTLRYDGVYTTSGGEFPATSGPFNLYINNNVQLHDGRTINGTLTLNSGTFTISNRSLTLNGSLTKGTGGSLSGGGSANIIVGGTSGTALDLPAVNLNNLSLNRSASGIRLLGNVNVAGTMTLTSGTLNLNGNTFSYGSDGTLLYNGSSAQITSSSEFPASGGPKNLTINNSVSVTLNDDRTVGGLLTLTNGQFIVGDSKTLTLNGPAIAGTPTLLATTSLSSLVFGGSSSGVSIPSTVQYLKNLTIQNSNGVTLTGGLNVSTSVMVGGYLRLGSNVIAGNGAFTTMAGSKLGIGHSDGVGGNITVSGTKTISGGTDYEFNGPTSQSTGFLPTSPSNNLRNLTVFTTGTLSYNQQMTASGSLNIMPFSKLNMIAGSSFTVNGDALLQGSNCLILSSPSGHGPTASLIINGNINHIMGASAEIRRYITNWTSNLDGWHFLSSPVKNQIIDPDFTDPNPPDYDFYQWDEPSNLWLNQKIPENHMTEFIPGEGYLIAYNTSEQIKKFSGELNNEDITFTNLSYTPPLPYHSWHLLGNPYSSAIKWNDGQWNLFNVNGICKIWNSEISNYTDIDPDNNIPAMNGFMVQVSEGANKLTIPRNSREHDLSTDWYKESSAIADQLKLIVVSDDNNTGCETRIRFNPLALTGFDHDLDCHFLPGLSQSPQFYSVTGSADNLSTNTLSYSEENKTVNLAFYKGISGSYTLTAAGLESFFHTVTIMLEDVVAAKSQDLRLNPVYTFSSSEGDNPNRFILHFGGTIGMEDKKEQSPFSIFSDGTSIFVQNNASGSQNGTIIIYNLVGQLIKCQTLTDGQMNRIDLVNGYGYYIVKVKTDKEIQTGKVWIN